MATITVRLFAAAREAAGTSRAELVASTLGEVVETLPHLFGPGFASVLGISRVWVNGDVQPMEYVLHDGDEVAVLPPISGG